MPSYARQTLNSPNPIARLAHRTRHRKSIELAAGVTPLHGRLLDFGCGEGAYLNEFSASRADVALVGFDPYAQHDGANYEKIASLDAVPEHSFDVVTCLETLEHLTDDETKGFFREVRRILRTDGNLIISVPIMGGPPLLLKEANRALLHRRRSDYSLRELASSAVLLKDAPRAADIKVSHKGWNHRVVPSLLEREGFAISSSVASPFEGLPWWLNSQVFFVAAFRRTKR